MQPQAFRFNQPTLWLFVIVLAIELAMAAVLVERLLPEPQTPDPEAPMLVISSPGDGFIQGTATISLQNYAPRGIEYVLQPEQGADLTLGQATATLQWDSTQVINGPYKIVAKAAGQTIAATTIEVQNARQELDTTAAVVGATTAVAAGGSAIGSSLASRAALTIAQIGKESLIAVGEDRIASKAKNRRRRQIGSRVAFALIIFLVLVFFSFEAIESYRLRAILSAIPIAGGVSAVFVALALGAEYLLGWASRARTGIRFLSSGAVSLALSSIVFRTPFGVPGYVEEIGDEGAGGAAAGETDDDEEPHVEGIRAMASMSVLVTLLIPFLLLGYAWNYAIAEQGLEIALIALATSSLPIRPLPGHDIWQWRKLPAVAFATMAFVLYFGFALAFMPPSIIFQVGIAGALLYAGTFVWLRARSAQPQPAWYPRVVEQWELAMADIRKAVPDIARRTSHSIERTTTRALAIGARLGNFALQPIVIAISKQSERRLHKQLRAAAVSRASNLTGILSEVSDLDDDAIYTTIDDDGKTLTRRVGDLRADAMRAKLYLLYGADYPQTVTSIDGDDANVIDLTRD